MVVLLVDLRQYSQEERLSLLGLFDIGSFMSTVPVSPGIFRVTWQETEESFLKLTGIPKELVTPW